MATTTTLTPSTDTFEIPCNLIVADQKQNTRKHLTDIDKLAKSIDHEGQQSPVLVARREDGKFDLIYGFRRFAALSWKKEDGGLGRETIKARVTDEMEPDERMLTNLIENMAREDLSSFDVAQACLELEKMTGGEMTGTKIANKVGKSRSYVDNLMRAMENLPPNVLARWKAEQSPNWEETGKGAKKVLTTDSLNRLAKTSLSAEERQLAFKKLTGEISEEELKASTGGTGTTAADKVLRASKAHLEEALASVKAALEIAKDGKKPDPVKASKCEGMIAALNFALGGTEGIKGIYTPETEEEKAKAKEAADKAKAKEAKAKAAAK